LSAKGRLRPRVARARDLGTLPRARLLDARELGGGRGAQRRCLDAPATADQLAHALGRGRHVLERELRRRGCEAVADQATPCVRRNERSHLFFENTLPTTSVSRELVVKMLAEGALH
jgi:hypothetical protein